MHKPTALLSVYNKEGIVEFARELVELGFNIISSGGTAKVLKDAGLTVADTTELVGEAILGHRIVTLSREIHAGLLARDTPADQEELYLRGIQMIDLVCVDLYPLHEAIREPDATRESVIEKTDIGGPTMLRSAAKGRRVVLCDVEDRKRVIDHFKKIKEEYLQALDGSKPIFKEHLEYGWISHLQLPESQQLVTELAAKAEGMVAGYCLASAQYHSGGNIRGMVGTQVLACKYGENAWQTPAGLYAVDNEDPLAVHRFKLVAGTPPSYNNICDVDRMLQTVTHIAAMQAYAGQLKIGLAVKHGNACGTAIHDTQFDTEEQEQPSSVDILKKMVLGDRRAIFGGLVLVNFVLDEELADILLTHGMTGGRRLLDGIIAPSFTPGAIELLKRKGDKCRFLQNAALAELGPHCVDRQERLRYVRGGFLAQPNYTFVPPREPFVIRNDPMAPPDMPLDIGKVCNGDYLDAMLAWAIGSTSNSNTITLVKNCMLIGNGVGQQDRVGCCELALKRARDAGHDPDDAVAYSDSFFPFPDGPQVLIDAGIRAILATSGSVNDNKTREICEKAGVRLYLLPDAEARGFFGH